MTVESILAAQSGRLRVINGIAVSEKDLFLVCGDQGFGYAIWRTGHDFKDARRVLGGTSSLRPGRGPARPNAS